MSRPTKTETSTTVGKDTQKNRTHVPLMKTSHRFVMPDESPVINLPKSVCRSTNNVPIAAKIALRIKPAAETRIVRSICSSARLYNERMQRRVIGPVRMEQNERISHLDDKRRYRRCGVLGLDLSGFPTLSRNLLISPFKSRNRPGQVPGTSDASKTQSGLIGTWERTERRSGT